jgi:hypothetical protein
VIYPKGRRRFQAATRNPHIYMSWGKVEPMIWTHKTNGLTESVFKFICEAITESRTAVMRLSVIILSHIPSMVTFC